MPDELAISLQTDLPRSVKLLLILKEIDRGAQIRDIKRVSEQHGFRIPTSWNCSSILKRTRGQAVQKPSGWEITSRGNDALVALGLMTSKRPTLRVANDLRELLPAIGDHRTQAFVRESIEAYENSLFRSAAVMSWLGAVDALQGNVVKHNLKEFNRECSRLDPKFKPIRDKNGLSRLKERDFLDRIAAIGAISKDVKIALIECLDRRNSCGHPNDYQLRDQTVAHHLETLIVNVFQPFAHQERDKESDMGRER